ncbi:hypothetical protein [Streptomyces sp. NPDC090994]|uniref:hypothetical protein n=1 Tax=Streptomyces sp. NPDC090994 TaxID=3365969 RepID=UPI00382ED2F8
MANGELHGYGPLLDTFVPRAVGLDARGKGTRPGWPGGAPVIRIYGGRGTGRTAVCQALHDRYVNRLHVAKWPATDRAVPAVAPPADGAGLLASRPLAALAWLVHELNAGVPRFGRIAFPRFTCAVLAVVTLEESAPRADPDGPSPAELATFQRQRQDLEQALEDSAGEPAVRERFGALVDATVPLLRWIPVLAPLEDLVRELLRQARRGRGGQGLDAAALRWWDERPLGVPGTGIEKLLRYAQHLGFELPAPARDDLERRLAAAFFADIDAYYRAWHFFTRPLPLVVLDDTHTPTGERLFDLLLTAYAEAAGPDPGRGADVSRPVLVSTRLGAGPGGVPGRDRHPVDVTRIGTLAWESPRGRSPDAWQLWLRAPALRTADIAAALGTGCPRGLPDVTGQISAGRAGLARPLIDAARQDLRRGRDSVLRRCATEGLGRALLGLPPAGPAEEASVADVLLHYLVPERSLIEPLLPWAVALRLDDVRRLPGPGDGEEPAGDRVRAFLRAGHWDRSPWAGEAGFVPPVGDRTLRELLLHRLRAECTPARRGPDGFAYWTRLHSAAAAHYGRAADDDRDALIARLHHTLALGRREEAVAGLHQLFGTADRRSWLAAVQFVCAAPRPPDGYAEQHPEGPGYCPACPGPRPDGRHRAVAALVTRLQDLSTLSSLYTDDPDSPDNRLRQLLSGFDIAYDDQDIATVEAARLWPALLAQGRRVPELPVPAERRDH